MVYRPEDLFLYYVKTMVFSEGLRVGSVVGNESVSVVTGLSIIMSIRNEQNMNYIYLSIYIKIQTEENKLHYKVSK